MVNLAEEYLVAGELAADGADPVDGDVGVICNYDVMAGVRDVFVVNEVAPVGKQVAGGTRVNTEVRSNLLFIVTGFTATCRA